MLIDSRRLAAFRLGFHVRDLRSILGEGLKGILFHHVPDVHPCRRAIQDAALVLSGQFTSMEAEALRTSLHQAGEFHDIACGIRPEEECGSERVAIGKLERDALDRIDFLVTRVGRKDADLASWVEVGTALADLRHKVSQVYENVTIPPEGWDQLSAAVERLSEGNRRLAGSFLFPIKQANIKQLPLRIREAYDDLCQCLASPELPPAQGDRTPTAPEPPVDVRSASGSVVLRGPKNPPLVMGKSMRRLSHAQYEVVRFVIQTGDRDVTKDELKLGSKHSDARGILRRLRTSDAFWEQVILMAETKGGGYRIK